MARLNGEWTAVQSSPATPKTGDTSQNLGASFMDTARRLLWRTNKAPSVNGQRQEEKSADQVQNADDDNFQENGVEDAVQDEEEIFKAVEEQALPLAIKIQIPAVKGKRKRADHCKGKKKRTKVQPNLPDEEAHLGSMRTKNLAPIVRQYGGRFLSTQDKASLSSDRPQSSSNIKTRGMTKMLQKAAEAETTNKSGRLKKASKDNGIQEDGIEPAIDLIEHALSPPKDHGGDTGIYDSHSPLEEQPIRSKAGRSTSSNPNKRHISSSSRVEKFTMEEERSGGEEESDEKEESPPELDSDPLIDFDHFEKMLTVANRVGHFHLKVSGEGRLLLREVDRAYQTNSGKRVAKALKKLSAAYGSLRNVRSNGDDSEEEKFVVIDCIGTVLDKVHDLIKTRFKTGTSLEYDKPVRTKHVLQDIYFVIVPQYVELLVLSARVNPLQESIDTENLQQFRSLVTTFSTLIHSACEIPSSHQLQIKDLTGKYGTKTFEISKPATQLKPMIRFVDKKLKVELVKRDRAANEVKLEEKRLAEALKQEERERAQALEHRRKVKEVNRRIKEAIASHPLYDHPLFGPELRKKDQEDKEKASLRQSNQSSHPHSRPSSASHHRQHGSGNENVRDQADQNDDQYENNAHDQEDNQDQEIQDEELDLSFLDQDLLEASDTEDRVRGVFGSNNSNHTSTPWTHAQYTIFIAMMQEDASDNRYSRAARELQLSMDEVFSLARDVQAAFDNCHEHGDLIESGDAWTYDVWIEPEVLG